MVLRYIDNWYRRRYPEPIITLDFDGLVSSSRTRARATDVDLVDPPVGGAINFILKLLSYRIVRVAIFCQRSRYLTGRTAMKDYIERAGTKHFYYSLPLEHRFAHIEPQENSPNRAINLWIEAGYPYTQALEYTYKGEVIINKKEHIKAGKWLKKQIYWPRRMPDSRIYLSSKVCYFGGSTWPDVNDLIHHCPWYRRNV